MSAPICPLAQAGCSQLGASHGWSVRPRSDEVHLWCASLDRHPTETLRRMESILSPDESDRADRFHFGRDRRRYVASRGILRTLLGEYLGCAPDVIRFAYGKHGKPSLVAETGGRPDEYAPLPIHFNVSHADALAVYAFACAGEVGVDVERRRELSDWRQVAATVFSPSEMARLGARPPEERQQAFFHEWTRQEAILKAAGEGIGTAIVADVAPGYSVYAFQPARVYAGAIAVMPGLTWATLRPWRDAPIGPRAKDWDGARIRLSDLSAGATNFL